MTKLKPCPFCGGDASIRTNIFGEYEIVCKKCFFSAFTSPKKKVAINRWNRRTNNATKTD